MKHHQLCPAWLAAAVLLQGGGCMAHEAGHPAEPSEPQADAPTWVARGRAAMQQARNTEAHDFSVAEKAFRRALEADAEDPEALLGLAWVANSRHDFESGREWARRSLEQRPGLVEAHALLSDGAVELGAYEEAYEHLQAALDLSSDLSTLSRAAYLVWLDGDVRKARWLMGKAIADGGTHPEHRAWCRATLSGIELRAGALIAAEAQAEQALEEAPTLPKARLALAMVRHHQGRYGDAIDLCERSIEIQPTHETLALLVDLHLLSGNEHEAAEWTSELLAFHESGHSHDGGEVHDHVHPGGSHQLARFLADHDRDLPRALAEARAAHEQFPNVFCADSLAWCLFKNGEPDEAARMIRRALRRGTPDPGIHFHAGLIFDALGQRERARRHLDRAFSLDPNFDPLRASRAREILARTDHAESGSAE